MAILGAMTAPDDTQEHPVVRAEAPSLEALYTAHAARLARVLRAAGLPDATDAVQEAFVQAVVHWRKVSTLRRPARLDPPRRDQPRASTGGARAAASDALTAADRDHVGRLCVRGARPRRRARRPHRGAAAAATARALALLLRRPAGRRSGRRDAAQRGNRQVPPARRARRTRTCPGEPFGRTDDA